MPNPGTTTTTGESHATQGGRANDTELTLEGNNMATQPSCQVRASPAHARGKDCGDLCVYHHSLTQLFPTQLTGDNDNNFMPTKKAATTKARKPITPAGATSCARPKAKAASDNESSFLMTGCLLRQGSTLGMSSPSPLKWTVFSSL